MALWMTACSTGTVYDLWFNQWQRYPKSVDAQTRQNLCKSIEALGYKLPFGSAVGNSYDAWREYAVVKTAYGEQWYGTRDYYVFVMALANIECDDASKRISTDAQDRLMQDARRLCRDVQYEASKLFSGTLHIALMQWDWSNGVRIQYGLTGSGNYSTTDCNRIEPLVTSIGTVMSQEQRNEAVCPSYQVSL
jgi:hypothetical protein